MQEIAMLDAIERYIRGEMLPEERVFFEQLRKSNPSVDQMVVEHTVFLNQMNKFGDRKNFRNTLNEVHNDLFEAGSIKERPQARIILWKKYQRVIAVAASIAGIVAIAISGLITYFSPKHSPEVELLKSRLNGVINKQKNFDQKLSATENALDNFKKSANAPTTQGKFGGTGFLLDARGYIATSAHVVNKADSVYVQNIKGEYFKVTPVYINDTTDVAILKIESKDFGNGKQLPYSIRKSGAEIGEEIFTLGYPRNEIVYNRGYLSAISGLNGDTMAYQIAIAANPGNSGGPIFNQSGEVIGILSGKQVSAEGVVFSSKARNIFKALDEIRKDTTTENLHVPLVSGVKDLDRVQQIKKIEDCIFIVRSY